MEKNPYRITKDTILVSPKKIEEVFNISVKLQANWRSVNKFNIPYYKIGGSVKYDLKEFIDWLNFIGVKSG